MQSKPTHGIKWIPLPESISIKHYSNYFNIVPLFSAPEAVLSAVGSMSSKPQDTLCLPPRRQEGEPGPPSKSNSLEQERYRISTRWENYEECFLNTESVPIQDIWHRESAQICLLLQQMNCVNEGLQRSPERVWDILNIRVCSKRGITFLELNRIKKNTSIQFYFCFWLI